MSWVYAELVLVSIGAMLLPTTLMFCVLAVVLAERPLRTGVLFYSGALGATLAIGIAAAFVLGDIAASETSTPKTWVAVLDVVAALLLLLYARRLHRRPLGPERQADMIEKMRKVASSPAIAIVAAGAVLANPGVFIPIALKTISETDPSTVQYAVEWLFFALVSLLPLLTAIVLLLVAPAWAARILDAARAWLERHLTTIALVVLVLVAASLLRNGISGLTA